MKNTTGIKLKHEVEQKKRSAGKLGGGRKVRAKQTMMLSFICLHIYKNTDKSYLGIDIYIHTPGEKLCHALSTLLWIKAKTSQPATGPDRSAHTVFISTGVLSVHILYQAGSHIYCYSELKHRSHVRKFTLQQHIYGHHVSIVCTDSHRFPRGLSVLLVIGITYSTTKNLRYQMCLCCTLNKNRIERPVSGPGTKWPRIKPRYR